MKTTIRPAYWAQADSFIHVQEKNECTVLVIAHRLSTIEACDDIIVMDNVRVREQGNHMELLRKKAYIESCTKYRYRGMLSRAKTHVKWKKLSDKSMSRL